ncbi:MAG: efflux RND transporter periplasmic adaptor subunit, partial [Thermoanaerobaculia bacterium]|nr:efflux RND transporter periplasmic adaptor subunit [Thermoanaerobaculia bacterium]
MKKKRLKVVLPLVAVGLALIVTVILVQARPPVEKEDSPRQVPLVRVMEVFPTDERLDVESQGTVEARRQSEIVSQVAGRIVHADSEFAQGGFFREGELMVRLDPRDYEVAVSQAEASLAQARTRLAREVAEAEVAREEWEELGTGEPGPLVLRKPQVEEARAAVEAAEAALMQARLNLERTEIRAPYDARILAKRADLGQFIAPGAPIATIYATDYAEVALPVTGRELGFVPLDRVGTGNPPRVRLSSEFAGEERRWEGRLVRTSGAIDPESRMLNLIARVDHPFRASSDFTPLQVGLYVQAEIEGIRVEDVFVIPRSALMRDGRV